MSRLTEAELIEAIEEESRLEQPMSQREREGFAHGFFAAEYEGEIRLLTAIGCLVEEDEEG